MPTVSTPPSQKTPGKRMMRGDSGPCKKGKPEGPREQWQQDFVEMIKEKKGKEKTLPQIAADFVATQLNSIQDLAEQSRVSVQVMNYVHIIIHGDK